MLIWRRRILWCEKETSALFLPFFHESAYNSNPIPDFEAGNRNKDLQTALIWDCNSRNMHTYTFLIKYVNIL